MFEKISKRTRTDLRGVLEPAIELAIEIAREGREGRHIGTLFTVGDSDAVLFHSYPLILDPLAGHPDELKMITEPNMRETVKELALLDGAFVVSDAGVVVSACRYLEASARGIKLRLGLGSRHLAAAAISRATAAAGIVVSESAMVRVFDDGKMIAEIVPEFWLLRQYQERLDPEAGDEPAGIGTRLPG